VWFVAMLGSPCVATAAVPLNPLRMLSLCGVLGCSPSKMKRSVAAAVLGAAAAAPAGDLVSSFPGFGAPLSKTYSGSWERRENASGVARAPGAALPRPPQQCWRRRALPRGSPRALVRPRSAGRTATQPMLVPGTARSHTLGRHTTHRAHPAGYLTIDSSAGKKHMHYLFYEAQKNPATAPVQLWLNGGPGCSSLEGAFQVRARRMLACAAYPPCRCSPDPRQLFIRRACSAPTLVPLQEGGPLWTAPGGAGLQFNNYSANSFANQLFLEAPACVGFSYADSAAGCSHDDYSQAVREKEQRRRGVACRACERRGGARRAWRWPFRPVSLLRRPLSPPLQVDNLNALIQFYAAFPEYAKNPFWITGEKRLFVNPAWWAPHDTLTSTTPAACVRLRPPL
jgi:hypothetical protein